MSLVMNSGSTIAVAANVDTSYSFVGVDSAKLLAACICGELMWRMSNSSTVDNDEVAALTRLLNFYHFRCYLIRLAWYGLTFCSATLLYVDYILLDSWLYRVPFGIPLGIHSVLHSVSELRSLVIWYWWLSIVLFTILLTLTHEAYDDDSQLRPHLIGILYDQIMPSSHVYILSSDAP